MRRLPSAKPSIAAAPSKAVPARVRSAFQYFDRNGSGYLDYRELRNALEHYGIDTNTAGARKVLRRYDDRPDGKLDVGEFGALVNDLDITQYLRLSVDPVSVNMPRVAASNCISVFVSAKKMNVAE